MQSRTFGSEWDAIENTPGIAEAMKLGSALMRHLQGHVRDRHWETAEAVRAFRVTQPRISNLLRGKADLFDLDALINMTVAAALHIEMRIVEPAVPNSIP